MQLSKRLFSKLKKKFSKEKHPVQKNLSPSILANRDEFIYDDDHISLYSFNDDLNITKMLTSPKSKNSSDLDVILALYADY
jgi:hypothetical protein